MSLFANARRRGFGVASVAAALCLCVAPLGEPTAAAAAGIFAVMDGNWQGDGSIKWYSGESEPIRCKSTNDVASDGYQLKQTLTCANPSLGEPWKINTDISYREAAGVIIGTWNEFALWAERPDYRAGQSDEDRCKGPAPSPTTTLPSASRSRRAAASRWST